MKVLIATDCSPAADLVLAEAAARPWPKDTSFTVINVVDLYRFAGLPALLEEGKRESDQVAAAVKVSAEPLERAGHMLRSTSSWVFREKPFRSTRRNGAPI